MAFLLSFVSQQLLFFIFKTSGYNDECDVLWHRSDRSLMSYIGQWTYHLHEETRKIVAWT